MEMRAIDKSIDTICTDIFNERIESNFFKLGYATHSETNDTLVILMSEERKILLKPEYLPSPTAKNRDDNYQNKLNESILALSDDIFYRHFKGGIYCKITDAEDYTSHEKMVVYKSEQDGKLWARPKTMWSEKIVINGKTKKRFERLKGM